jgi:hypothetical protein
MASPVFGVMKCLCRDRGHNVTILTYAERQKYWNWCREFIDREAIYRADETHPAIPGKFGGTYVWQFYYAAPRRAQRQGSITGPALSSTKSWPPPGR